MQPFIRAIRQLFPGAVFPKNFAPLFPDRFMLPTEAREMVGGEKEFERLRKDYPEIIRAYNRGERGGATKFRLWEIQDAIQQDAKDQRQKYLREPRFNRRP